MTSDANGMRVVPSGRVLHRAVDTSRYVVVKRAQQPGFWIVEDGWGATSEAAGPFREKDALRALRLANTSVPEGCELGPWQNGLGLFERTRLPGHPSDWSRVEPEWLEPSVSRYGQADIDGVVNEICCAPPRDEPRIDWSPVLPDSDVAWRAMVSSRHPHLDARVIGVLARAWNAHPKDSPIVASDRDLSGEFAVIDLASG